MIRASIEVPGLEHGANPIPAASRVGPLLATGAVRGVDRDTGQLPKDAAREVDLAFDNLESLVRAGGARPEHIVHVDVFLGARHLRAHVNEAWIRLFPDPASRPARHVIHHELPGGMRVQLEALAFVTEVTQEEAG